LPTAAAALELQTLLDATVDAIIIIDQHGLIERFNKAAERLFGYPEHEIVGKNVSLLMGDEHRAHHDSYLRNYLATGSAKIIGTGREIEALRRDGSTFPAALSVGEIPSRQNPRFVGVIHDISIRRATMAALRQERDRAQLYLDATEVLLVAIDPNGLIVLVNRKGCEVLGFAEAELIGRDWFEQVIPLQDRAAARAQFQAAIDRTTPSYSERLVRTRHGDTRLIAWRTTVVRSSESKTLSFLSSGEDITERRLTETQLRARESHLRAAQHIAHLGNYEYHCASGTAHWSDEMFHILGRDLGEGPASYDLFCLNYLHSDDRDGYAQQWQRILSGQPTGDFEFRIIRPNGGVRYVHLLAQTARNPSDGGLVITGTLHDVTERSLAASNAQQMQEKLAHVGRLSTMGEMATGLAHELNQPLTAIATYAQAALRLMTQADTEEDVKEALKQITAQSLRAGEVIRHLRSFVKTHVAKTEPTDLNQLVQDLRVLADADARANTIRLVLRLEDHLPSVQADTVQIQQVLLNLFRNAIDATERGSGESREITITTRRVDDKVEVAVIDHGSGIPTEIAANIFSPFFTTKTEGTGLGLAISNSIIRAHNGILGFRQTPGGGTTFHLTLPTLAGDDNER
jgi:PAS domain S-box-containing protein